MSGFGGIEELGGYGRGVAASRGAHGGIYGLGLLGTLRVAKARLWASPATCVFHACAKDTTGDPGTEWLIRVRARSLMRRSVLRGLRTLRGSRLSGTSSAQAGGSTRVIAVVASAELEGERGGRTSGAARGLCGALGSVREAGARMPLRGVLSRNRRQEMGKDKKTRARHMIVAEGSRGTGAGGGPRRRRAQLGSALVATGDSLAATRAILSFLAPLESLCSRPPPLSRHPMRPATFASS